MSWFADLAGKAENLLNNLDEQTGAALRNHNISKQHKHDKNDHTLHPEPTWGQKKRPIPRSLKKITPVTETRSNSTASRKPSATHNLPRSPVRNSQDNVKNGPPKAKKAVSRKTSPQYTLDRCPKTMVGDLKDNEIIMDQFGLKQRRYSLPVDLEIVNNEEWTYRMQNLEVENAMLKNELNVMNREVSELLDRLRTTEDGNNVVNSCTEMSKTHAKLGNAELQNHKINLDKESLSSQLQELKYKIHDLTTVEMSKYKEQNQSMETEVCLLRDRNKEVEDKITDLTEKSNEKDSIQMRLESELRHAHSTIEDLQNNLEKTTAECHRLEKDWETYKLRVKSMLHSKDNEIKALQEGMNHTEDTKMLVEQMEVLKDERDELSEAVSSVRGECDGMKRYVEQLESRHNAAERVVAALRDALRDERAARNGAEAQCVALGKELKSMQMESGQTIAGLRTALRDKDAELNHLRESASSVRSTDTSALNVADYDVMQDNADHEKVHCLTQTLVQKQGKIESLMADNNILKIQLEKLETKYKIEVASRMNSHSVVHLQDGDGRARTRHHAPDSMLSALSMKIGVMIRRNPIFRIFILFYMIGLHLWVLTVLFTSTPEDYVPRPVKS